MTVLTIFVFESQLMQMPGPKDIVIYWPGPRTFSVVQKPWGWAHILVQKPRGGGGMVTGQIDTCIKRTGGGGSSGGRTPSSTPSISDIIPFGSISLVCKSRYHKVVGFHFRNKNVIRQTLFPNLHTYIKMFIQ